MKTLKLEHELAEAIRQGIKRSTWRLFDEKDISVGDRLELVDKVDSGNPKTWKAIGQAEVTRVVEKRLNDIDNNDYEKHETYQSKQQMLKRYRGYYGNKVTLDTPVKIIVFK